jgi:hypothetical protein
MRRLRVSGSARISPPQRLLREANHGDLRGFPRHQTDAAMKRPREKDPRKLIELGARLAEAKRTLPAIEYDAFKRREPELRHEAKPGQLTRDKDGRLIRIASIPALRENIGSLPWVGWGGLRELSKLGESTLRCLLERGTINRRSTRADIDDLRSAQKRGHVAERHRGDNLRGKARRS